MGVLPLYVTSLWAVIFFVQPFMDLGLAISSSSNLTDQSALLAFKSGIQFDPNNVLTSNWTEGSNFCDWFGVSCSRRRQRVTALQLPNMGLRGTISPRIGNLSFMVRLNLLNNTFHGNLPHEIGQLRRLKHLLVEGNFLQGEVPTSISHCQKLKILSLRRNNFGGNFPLPLTTLPSLQRVFLGRNNFSGVIPPSIGNMSSLEWFGVELNMILGNIPNQIIHLRNLKGFNVASNYLTGPIPPAVFNISSLQQLILSLNFLSGTLPSTTGLLLPYLEKLELGRNELSGEIPLHLANSTKLSSLLLVYNYFTGPVPTNFGRLQFLSRCSFAANQLTRAPGTTELTFLTALTNCTSLALLDISDNPFGAILPRSVANLSSLTEFYASSCHIEGQLPRGIASLSVSLLDLRNNHLLGSIPSEIGHMEGLQRIYLDGNTLEGSIPDEICRLSKNLGELYLSNNKLSGPIPSCIGNLSNLQILLLDSNSLNSSMPLGLWSLENLLLLNLSSNSLTGSLDSNIRPSRSLGSMDLSWNQISGQIPSIVGAFESITSLNLSRNSFQGPIPESLGRLITLDYLDLSHNNLSGTIPRSLQALSHIIYLNFSSNQLSGEIPSGGPFKNFNRQSFLENGALCGQPYLQFPPCKGHTTAHTSWIKSVLGCILAVIALIIIFVVYFVIRKYKLKQSTQADENSSLPEQRIFPYRELCEATNNFSEANLLGVGSYGSVYKGTLLDGTIVAVKILNLHLEGAFKSFDAECRVLRTVRHRNLVKVISSCSNVELRALILQYMPKGSLEKWLYSHNYCLDLCQRVGIMLDVASALEYLHHGQPDSVVHCDLKPGNILLDEDMVAHVGDFGIAKIIAADNTTTQTATLGTLGYIAPEYGSAGIVSTKGDVYSYGITLLEMFTRKKPTDEMFAGGQTLRQWVAASLPDKVIDIIDSGLLTKGDAKGETLRQWVDASLPEKVIDIIDSGLLTKGDAKGGDMSTIFLAIMKLGVVCSAEFPDERIDIKEAIMQLNQIKSQLC